MIRFNADAAPERFIPLAAAMGVPVEGVPGLVAAELLAERVRQLADEVGVPRGLADIGVREQDIDRLTATTLDDACLATNPRPTSSSDIAALFRAAM